MSYDDKPVGQHSGVAIPELPPEAPPSEPAPASGSLNDNLLSKNSKTRLEAFSSLLKLFTESEGSNSIFSEHYPLFHKYISDAHPGAQDKALESLLVLINKSPPHSIPTDKTLTDIVCSLIEKGITSAKANIKAKACDCLTSIVELEGAKALVQEAILGYINEKSTAAKTIAGALNALTLLLSQFGDKVFSIKDFLSSVVTQAASTNSSVKTEAMAFIKEAHRWVGESVTSAIETLKTAQKEELKKQFQESVEPPVPKKTVKGSVEVMEDSPKKKSEAKKDTYNSAQEVSALKKFGETWCEHILELKKWAEKKVKLEELAKAVDVEKIKAENVNELSQTLKKLLNDSNIVVVNLAIKIIGLLARGLRNQLSGFAKHIFQSIIQKCKDRKTTTESLKCLEYLALSIKVEDIVEDLKEILGDKSPLVKMRVCWWLETIVLPKATEAQVHTIFSALSPTLIKLTDDAVSDVRDSALSCIGVIKVLVNDEGFNNTIQEMSQQKQQKISKAAEQIKKPNSDVAMQEEDKKETKGNTKADTLTKKMEEEEKIPKKELEDKPISGISKEIAPEKDKKKADLIVIDDADADATKKPKPKPRPLTKKKEEKKTGAGKKSDSGKKESKIKEIKEEDIGPTMTDEDATKQVEGSVPPSITQGESTDWKERQKKLQDLNEWLAKTQNLTPEFAEALGIWLKKKVKDFKESNLNVLKEAFAVINTVATTIVITKKFACVMVPPLIEKMSDAKHLDTCINILLAISDSVTPTYVSLITMRLTQGAKSITQIKGALTLLTKMVEEYTPKMMPINVCIDFAKHCLENSNVQVRNSATKYIATVYSAVGDVIKPIIVSDLKDSTLKSMEAELAKVQFVDQKDLSEPKRKLKGESEAEAQSKKKVKSIADSLVPRTSIASQITSKIISGLTDSAMKKRQEAKDAIDKILAAANNRILPAGLAPLMGALKTRMNEPGKNLAKAFITLVGNLAAAMGTGAKQYNKVILQPLMNNLADKQTFIRTETLTAVDKFAEAAGAEVVINNIPPLLEKDNPELRNELLTWILKNKAYLAKSDTASLVNAIVAAMQDRSKEIRGLAEEVAAEVMPHVGYQIFDNAIQDLKPIVKSSLQTTLEKYKQIYKVKQGTMEDVPISNGEAKVEKMKVEEQKEVAMIEPEIKIMKEDKKEEEKELIVIDDNFSTTMSSNTMSAESPKTALVNRTPLAKTLSKAETSKKPGEGSTRKVAESPSSSTNKKPKSTFLINKNGKRPTTAATGLAPTQKEEAKKVSNTVKKIQQQANAMSSSKSTSELIKNKAPRPGTMSRMSSKKDILRRDSTSKAAHGMMKQSPSKGSLSGSSGAGGLIVETVVLNPIGNKNKREEADKNAKWPVNEIRTDYVEKLEKALKPAVHPSIFDYMFATQFKKNLEAIKILTDAIKSDFSSIVDILDLLFKWVTIKMVDQSNTAINKGIIELLQAFFAEIAQQKYTLRDFEAAAILPVLCERLGTTNATLKDDIRDLVRKSCEIVNPPKVANYLVRALDTKNPKTKIESVSMLREFIAKNTLKIMAPRDIKSVSKLIGSVDNTLKTEVIEFLIEIYKQKGDRVWTFIGEIHEKNKELLKQKFAAIPQNLSLQEAKEEEKAVAAPVDENGLRQSTKNISLSNTTKENSPVITQEDGQTTDLQQPPVVMRTEESVMTDIQPKGIEMGLETETEAAKNILVDTLELEEDKDTDGMHERQKSATDPSPYKPIAKKEGIESSQPESLEPCLDQLKFGDVAKKLEAVVALSEKATTYLESNKDILIKKSNIVFETFTDVLKDIFEKSPRDFPIRFGVYFLSVFNKLCSIKEVVRELNEQTMSSMLEQLFIKLSYEGLDKLGESGEGESMAKMLNTITLRLLENCESTRTFIVLFGIFRKHKDTAPSLAHEGIRKVPGLAIKCLVKLNKIMQLLITSLNIGKLLLCMHEYLLFSPPTSQTKNPNDEMGIRVVKNILNEVVKIRKEGIWDDYRIIEHHEKQDKYIKRWIVIVLKSMLDAPTAAPALSANTNTIVNKPEEELKAIFQNLNSESTFNDAIKSLKEYMQSHPGIDLQKYFAYCSKSFSQLVMNALQGNSTEMKDIQGIQMQNNVLDGAKSSKEPSLAIASPNLEKPETLEDMKTQGISIDQGISTSNTQIEEVKPQQKGDNSQGTSKLIQPKTANSPTEPC